VNDGPEPLRDVIARHGLQASKSLGQNFILDRQLLARIAAVPGPLAGERVYEVGPGPGGLTQALLAAGASVVAVERDRRCLPALAELEALHPDRLRVLEADALAIDERSAVGEGAHVVSNLPYNVGTALLLRWLSGPWPPWWRSLALMFQREVAERIVAAPGAKSYGRLAVLSQWRTVPKILFDVAPSAFVPPPKVVSSVVSLIPRPVPLACEQRLLERVTAAAFGQRRKMLRQSLKGLGRDPLPLIAACGIAETARAEEVPVEGFVALANALAAAERSGA